MIQNITPNRLQNEYRPCPPGADSRILAFDQGKILCRIEDKRLHFLRYGEWKMPEQEERECLIYLFSIGEDTYYLYNGEERLEPEGFGYEKMFLLRGMLPREERFAGATAYHLHCWYEQNRYCGRCAKELVRDPKQRRLYCPECGNEVFPRINPAVIVGVCHEGKLLLTKYADREYKRYALIAGFAEIGETIEETVKREVLEETGIRVKNIRYYKSQPWGFSGSLLMGFFAQAEGSLEIHREEAELSEALWVEREEIDPGEEGVSLTEEMMRVFCEKGVNFPKED